MNKLRRTFQIHGMCCAEEVAALKRELTPLVGGEDRLAFDLLQGRMFVSEEATASSEAILQAVSRTGMRAEPWSEALATGHSARPLALRARTLLTACSAGLILFALVLHAASGAGWLGALGWSEAEGAHHLPGVAKGLYGLAAACAAWFVLPKAWLSLRRLRPDMNLLMTLAVLGAIGLGEWFEASTVAFLFSLSLTLEGWSLGRARRAVQALLRLTPDSVHLVSGCGCCAAEDKPPESVSVGTRFRVLPGERVPLDGTVVEGEGETNEAPLTGESLPVPKGPGSALFAGSINGSTVLVAESTHAASDTVLARIIRLVEDAQGRRAPAEQWVERFAKIYTPLVLLLAALVIILPPLAGLGTWSAWFYRGLVLLVIGCPCALVISTPVSIVSGLASAARHGVLIKGGAFLEAPAHLKAIAFDKTGTLTLGKLEVVAFRALNHVPEREVLALAAGLEASSKHPLAEAILSFARHREIAPRHGLGGLRILPGRGIEGREGETVLWLGSARLARERSALGSDAESLLAEASRSGQTLAFLGRDTQLLGAFLLSDRLRPEVAAVMEDLRSRGVAHLVMLTGDHREAAACIAIEAGLSEFEAELLPEDKLVAVERLVQTYGQVAMVGDGVNDAPALARASVGIAMGAAGSDTALETADIALMKDDLTRLPWLVGHSRRTLAIIRQNITFALSVKALFILLTLAGHASLWAAIAADMGASLLVVANGMRLLKA